MVNIEDTCIYNMKYLKTKRSMLIGEYNKVYNKYSSLSENIESSEQYNRSNNCRQRLNKIDDKIIEATDRIGRIGNKICDGHPILLSTGFFVTAHRQLICLCAECDAIVLVPEEEVINRTRRFINSKLDPKILMELYQDYKSECGSDYDSILHKMKQQIPLTAAQQKSKQRG